MIIKKEKDDRRTTAKKKKKLNSQVHKNKKDLTNALLNSQIKFQAGQLIARSAI